MGFHKAGLVSIGAFVKIELCDYIDKFAEAHGLSTRSDAIRAILREHKAAVADRIDRNTALTPFQGEGNDNLQGSLDKKTKSKRK